jgi:hypothetical protein
LKDHVPYSIKTAQNYMSVARFVEKNESAFVFFDAEPTILYRMAALPDKTAATLKLDTLLTDPKTGRQKPLKDMTSRVLTSTVPRRTTSPCEPAP